MKKRNQSMECCKMLMTFLVVFNHFPFPGFLNEMLAWPACFVVATFFAISGYFNYGATPKQLKRRLLHIAQLNIAADLFHILWTCVYTELQGGSTIAYLRAVVPDANELMWWLITNRNSFLGHLWYLASIGTAYAFLWLYTSFFRGRKVDYKPLYFMASCLFTVFFATGIVMPVAGVDLGGQVYRNGWFLAIPMFTLGIFLHEFQDQIVEGFQLTNRKLGITYLACFGLTVFQIYAIGLSAYSISMPMAVISAMLLMILNPTPFREDGWFARKLIIHFGSWSTYIYLFHLTVGMIFTHFFREGMIASLGSLEPWVTPAVVYLVSFLFAVVYDRCETFVRKSLRKTDKARS